MRDTKRTTSPSRKVLGLRKTLKCNAACHNQVAVFSSHRFPPPPPRTSRMPDTRRRLRLAFNGSASRARSCHSSSWRSSASARELSSGVMSW